MAKKETPLMKQYNAIKVKYPDALLLFRVGDFYETFGSDAVRTAGILGIILTKRGAGSESETELAGFPHHSLNTYLPKLVKAGERVAICDQLEDPKQTKTIVKHKLVVNKYNHLRLHVASARLFLSCPRANRVRLLPLLRVDYISFGISINPLLFALATSAITFGLYFTFYNTRCKAFWF